MSNTNPQQHNESPNPFQAMPASEEIINLLA